MISTEISTIVEECLSKSGIEVFRNINKSKSAIVTAKNDLTTLMTTLKETVC